MEGRLFTLADATDHFSIFMWGMEISHGDDVTAVCYRRDPDTGEITNGVHGSAETARALYSRLVRRYLPHGLHVVWMDGSEDNVAELVDPDPDPEPVLALT